MNPQTNRLRFATNNLEYDAAGNVRIDPKFRGLRYEYDAEGRMSRTTNLDGGAETTSVYDGAGQRVINTVGSESHHFVYAVTGQVIAEYGPSGWERDRVYRGEELLATEEAIGTCRKTVEQFVEAFYRGALDRAPTDAEKSSWVARLRAAQGEGHNAVLGEAKALGRALFESAEYAARQRSDEEFVNDLYWGYLQRAPDAGGFRFWLDYVRVNGRPATVTAFGASIEFDANVRGLCEIAEVTGERHWLLTDHVGSVRVITDERGEVVGRRDNQPFGQPVLDVGTTEAMGARSMSLSAAPGTGLWTWHNSVRPMFAGMEKDVGTGLDHTPFRKYESALGRWTSPDPYPGSMDTGDPQSLNRYAYVRNDPVNMIDPEGLAMCSAEYSFSQCGGWGGIIGGYFGDNYAIHQRYYGGLSAETTAAMMQHEERVNNAMSGNGYRTNAEVNSETFQVRYWVNPDGSVTIEEFRISPVDVRAELSWYERGAWNEFGLGLRGFAVGLTSVPFTDWNAVDAIERRMGRLSPAEEEWLRDNRSYTIGGYAGTMGQALIPAGGAVKGIQAVRAAREPVIRGVRIAPFGNATHHPFGRWPHYHRRGPLGPRGVPRPGQGIGRHRPFEPSRHDRSFWDRF